MNSCPCGSNLDYSKCCEQIIKGTRKAQTAEEVMRARYSAYANKEFAYLLTSLYPPTRSTYDEPGTIEWAKNTTWTNLKIIDKNNGSINDNEGQVEFIASYTENGVDKKHHELASFKKQNDIWYFVDGALPPVKQIIRTTEKIGRNDPCPCGSGKKFKKCCREKT